MELSSELMSSNETLRKVVDSFSNNSYSGAKAAKRPDLLLHQDEHDNYLLIEFKRPQHYITREDIAQADSYRDELTPHLTSGRSIEIIMIGKGRSPSIDERTVHATIKIMSYVGLISAARREMDWLINSLSN